MSRAAVGLVVALLATTAATAWSRTAAADPVEIGVHQLGTAGSYKIRLAAALSLSKSHDPRAVIALADALGNDDDPSIRRVSALALGKMVTIRTADDARELAYAALDKAAANDDDDKVRDTASSARRLVGATRHHAAATSSTSNGARGPAVFVNVDTATDQSRKLSGDAGARLTAIVKKSVERTGYATTWPGGLPTEADLTSSHARGFIVASTVKKLDFTKMSNQTEIACTVAIRISPWGGTDGGERWEANKAASASGSAKAMTGTGDRDIQGGVRDCIEAVAEDISNRQVVPFLKKLASAP